MAVVVPETKPERLSGIRCSALSWKAGVLQPSSALAPCSPCSAVLWAVCAEGGCTTPHPSDRLLKALIPRRPAPAPKTCSSQTVLSDSCGQPVTVSLSPGSLSRLLGRSSLGVRVEIPSMFVPLPCCQSLLTDVAGSAVSPGAASLLVCFPVVIKL